MKIEDLVDNLFDYDSSKSEYELAKDNKVFLVIHGSGYGDIPPEEEWVDTFNGYSIEDTVANDYVIKNFDRQHLAYFKEIELAEEWDLEDEFLEELWNARKGEWNTYSDLSGVVYFKCYQEK
jgi:hypothetical protein